MPESPVNLPGVGKLPRRTVYILAALAAGIVGYAWFTRRSDEGEAETEVDYLVPEEVEPTGTLPFGGTQSGTFTEGPVAFRNDQEWFGAAVEKLIYDYGVADVTIASDALDRYMDRRPLTKAQVPMVNFVLRSIGPPPSGNRDIRVETTTPGGSTPPPTQAPRRVVFKPASVTRTSILFDWDPVAGATYYNVLPKRGPASGGGSLALRAVAASQWAWYGLQPGRAYGVTVVAYDSSQREIARAFQDARTKR